MLVHATKAQKVLADQESRNIAPLAEHPIWIAPEVDLLEVPGLWVKLDHLRCTEPHFETTVVALTPEEKVHLVLVHARAESEYAFDLRQACLAVLLKQAVLG